MRTTFDNLPFLKEELRSAPLACLRLLLNRYGLSNWGVRYLRNGSYSTYGLCEHSKKRIALNRDFCENGEIEQILDTILHEIAHALTPGAKHGYAWKRKCLEIGAMPERCYNGDYKVRNSNEFSAKYHLIDTRTNRVVKVYGKKPAEKVIKTIHKRFLTNDRSSLGHLAFKKVG